MVTVQSEVEQNKHHPQIVAVGSTHSTHVCDKFRTVVTGLALGLFVLFRQLKAGLRGTTDSI